jgi:hypothetical protein
MFHLILRTHCKKSSSRPAGNKGCTHPYLSFTSDVSSTAGINVCSTYIATEHRARSNGEGRNMPILCAGQRCVALPAAGGQNSSISYQRARGRRDNGDRHKAVATRRRRPQQQRKRHGKTMPAAAAALRALAGVPRSHGVCRCAPPARPIRVPAHVPYHFSCTHAPQSPKGSALPRGLNGAGALRSAYPPLSPGVRISCARSGPQRLTPPVETLPRSFRFLRCLRSQLSTCDGEVKPATLNRSVFKLRYRHGSDCRNVDVTVGHQT